METFDECSVLIPSATLEDFGSGVSEADARSLLAGWTCLWHPKLLADTEQLPTWYRADSPPEPDGPRVVVVPLPSEETLPASFRHKCDANPACFWVTGANRSEMLRQLELDETQQPLRTLQHNARLIGVEDFFAAGYLTLQIQIMTRRLRYTSNLDEIYLQTRAVAAAKAFLSGDAATADDALHEVFDALAEERDHYFSSDPYLVDLTLLTPAVLEKAIASGWAERIGLQASVGEPDHGILGTPRNLLVDGQVAQFLNRNPDSQTHQVFRELLAHDGIDWAGGGPSLAEDPSGTSSPTDAFAGVLDGQTMNTAVEDLLAGREAAKSACGKPPAVFARLSGMTPSDVLPHLDRCGYQGVIPLDFVAGTGFGEESKVLVGSANSDLQALTSKPIDASSDLSFATLGAILGEAIDTGEIATALLVHWPDQQCDSFADLCRAATWSVALGKFWSIESYFADGERPYHNGTIESLSKQSAGTLAAAVDDRDSGQTLQGFAEAFCRRVQSETDDIGRAIAALANPVVLDDAPSDRSASDGATPADVAERVGTAFQLAAVVDEGKAAAPRKRYFNFNPHSVSARTSATLDQAGPISEKFVYAATGSAGNRCEATFDVPALGFTEICAERSIPKPGLLKRFGGGGKSIAEACLLKNEFMAVSLSETSGGIQGVYSASRGNRLSMRLVAEEGSDAESQMECTKVTVTESSEARGVIESTGTIKDSGGEVLAEFHIRYELERGRRELEMSGTVRPRRGAGPAKALWKNYFALRTAVAGEAMLTRPLVRDKVHMTSMRRMVAPLGVLIDESEKQTLVASHGMPLHRRVGDRFLDTLIGPVGGDSENEELGFTITYSIDSTHPVATARRCIAPVLSLPVTANGSERSRQAWLIHISSKEILLADMRIGRRQDGKLAAQLRLIQTRPKSVSAKLQFCTFAQAAFVADDSGIDRSLDEQDEQVSCEDGVVKLSLSGHETVDLVVVFDV